MTCTWKELFDVLNRFRLKDLQNFVFLFFLRPLPYEALTQLIDEASEGDMNISILTQVSRVIKPNLLIDILKFVYS